MIQAERVDDITIEKMVDEDNGQQLGRRLKGNGGKSANAATPTTTGEMSKCNVEQVELTRDEYARIDINQMAFPFIFFTMCTVLAIILQLGKCLSWVIASYKYKYLSRLPMHHFA